VFRGWRAPEAANGGQADGLERGLTGIDLNNKLGRLPFALEVSDDERTDACDKSFLSLSQGKEACHRTWDGA
jgi:hypothetical protein